MSAFGALASIADNYSDTESDEDMETCVVSYESTEDFVRECILASVLKESVRRVEFARSVKYRNNDEESSSSSEDSMRLASDSSSSEDDSDCDDGGMVLGSNKEASSRKAKKPPPRVKGEFLPCDLPPIEDLHITVPEYECIQIGVIASIVDDMVVVKTAPNTAALDLDSVLFLEKGKRPLGRVFDVMGPVVQPIYCVRFNSNEHVAKHNIKAGMEVFYAPRTEHTAFIFLDELMKLKGSDASWENDKEPPPSHIDYSDDEEERRARRKNPSNVESGESSQGAYVLPQAQVRSNNAFYRNERRYNPRNYGPIQWNSVHTQHLNRPQRPYGPFPAGNRGQRFPRGGNPRAPFP